MKSQDAIRKSARIRALIAFVSRRQITCGSARKEVTCPDRKPAGSDDGIEFVDVRSRWVGCFLHRAQHRGWGSGTTFGDVFDERNESLQGQLLDALALCCCDSLKAPRKVVRHFDIQVRHWPALLYPIVRVAGDDAKPTCLVGSNPGPGTNVSYLIQ